MDIQEQVRKFLGEELQAPQEALANDYPLITNHVIDSLGLLQIVSFLESEFSVEVQDEEIVPENFDTIAAIAKLAESKLAQSSG